MAPQARIWALVVLILIVGPCLYLPSYSSPQGYGILAQYRGGGGGSAAGTRAGAGGGGWGALPRPKKEIVRVIVQECCRDDLIEDQVALLHKFLYESIDLVVVLATKNLTLKASMHTKAPVLNITVSECPDADLDSCYNFSYRRWVAKFTGLVVFANDDMFLWRPFSVRRYKQQWGFDIAAMVETHATEYLHPGFHILDTATLPADISAISWKAKSGTDTGGSTIDWLRSHPDVKVHPLAWSRNMQPDTLVALRLIPLELAELLTSTNKLSPVMRSDLYLEDFAILHPRGSSNWQQDAPEKNAERISKFKAFVQGRLQGLPLTWSDRGASTSAHIAQLLKHTDGWLLPAVVPQSPEDEALMQPRAYPGSAGVPNPKPAFANPVALVTLAADHGAMADLKAPKASAVWMQLLAAEADRLKAVVAAKVAEIGPAKLLLPPADPPRTNLDLKPPRLDAEMYKNSTVYYWKYVYNASTPDRGPEYTTNCAKHPGQKYFIATYAAGAKRTRLANMGLRPTCLAQGADEVVIWGPEDLDADFKERNKAVLADPHGVGNWIWKHYVQYAMLERLRPNDVFFYMDSDMNCTSDLLGYFCLANKNDVTPFHHSNPWYTLARLSKRDTLVFMGMDHERVARSVQYSGGNVFYKKTERSVKYVRELAAWSQQPVVVQGYGSSSNYSVDWPEYDAQRMHQCDQAVSSVLIMKYGWKSFPWVREGFGSGSDDAQNAAERAECGMPIGANIRTDNLDRR